MLNCTIAGCKECASELLTEPHILARWLVLRACRCGAYDGRQQKACDCPGQAEPFPIQYWPNLDWFALGGVEEMTLCPEHRVLVAQEIVKQRTDDASMDWGGAGRRQYRGNIH
jgi:hypothetical protein